MCHSVRTYAFVKLLKFKLRSSVCVRIYGRDAPKSVNLDKFLNLSLRPLLVFELRVDTELAVQDLPLSFIHLDDSGAVRFCVHSRSIRCMTFVLLHDDHGRENARYNAMVEDGALAVAGKISEQILGIFFVLSVYFMITHIQYSVWLSVVSTK